MAEDQSARLKSYSFCINRLDKYVCLVVQSCLTLCDPMDCSPPGSSVNGDSPGENTGVGCHVLLQGIFPTQGSNSGLRHCRQILYQLSHQGSPILLTTYTLKSGTARSYGTSVFTTHACACVLAQWSSEWLLPITEHQHREMVPFP